MDEDALGAVSPADLTGSVFAIAEHTGVIAFCKDWDDDPTSNHHVMSELARTRTVVWLNSLGMRRPSLGSGKDRRRLWRKIGQLLQAPRNVRDRLWVITPLVLPFPHSPIAARLNVLLLGFAFWRLRRRLGLDEFQLWTFLPNVAPYVGRFGESLSVYYCVDEFSLFAELDTRRTVRAERKLLAKVDCVFAVNEALLSSKLAFNPETHLARHGVDRGVFARALDPETVVPPELAALPQPVIGFYGSIDGWVDMELLAGIARQRPDWTLALIGPVRADTSELDGLPNVHLLGRREHDRLPAYCKGFAAGLIPYRIDERSPYINPIKLREYLAAGLPVVSTPLNEVVGHGSLCTVAYDAPGFVAAIEEALASDTADAALLRSESMSAGTWAARVEAVSHIVAGLARRRR